MSYTVSIQMVLRKQWHRKVGIDYDTRKVTGN